MDPWTMMMMKGMSKGMWGKGKGKGGGSPKIPDDPNGEPPSADEIEGFCALWAIGEDPWDGKGMPSIGGESAQGAF